MCLAVGWCVGAAPTSTLLCVSMLSGTPTTVKPKLTEAFSHLACFAGDGGKLPRPRLRPATMTVTDRRESSSAAPVPCRVHPVVHPSPSSVYWTRQAYDNSRNESCLRSTTPSLVQPPIHPSLTPDGPPPPALISSAEFMHAVPAVRCPPSEFSGLHVSSTGC